VNRIPSFNLKKTSEIKGQFEENITKYRFLCTDYAMSRAQPEAARGAQLEERAPNG
jgi:hypothetical protein